MKYTINTRINDFKIEQDLIMDPEIDGIRAQILRRVIDTQDAQIRQALIDLGWEMKEWVWWCLVLGFVVFFYSIASYDEAQPRRVNQEVHP